ncbi:hypothetical protein [Francisella marina]|uniref:hypothetical protein n=1 Tax=Francisella marina TaxID=2249302 RepID=UPI0011F0610E|nr:hypothetical protein [Francisella marina]QEO58316.1 hypothetical protein F0R75_00465 [Francisella marina]
MKIRRKYCKNCKDYVKAEAPQTRIVFHLLMTLLTGGLWLIVWLLAGGSSKYRCSHCGTVCR